MCGSGAGSCVAATDMTGLVLAGGQSRRWGGIDKSWVRLTGRPLVQHVSERLAAQSAAVWISTNRDPAPFLALADAVLADDWLDGRGPLAGIATALRRIPTPWLLVAPVDSPLLPLNLGSQLGIAALREGRLLATVDDGEYLQPAFLLIHRDLAGALVHAVDQGIRRLGAWVQAQHPARVDARAAAWGDQLRGANNGAELDALRALIGELGDDFDGGR